MLTLRQVLEPLEREGRNLVDKVRSNETAMLVGGAIMEFLVQSLSLLDTADAVINFAAARRFNADWRSPLPSTLVLSPANERFFSGHPLLCVWHLNVLDAFVAKGLLTRGAKKGVAKFLAHFGAHLGVRYSISNALSRTLGRGDKVEVKGVRCEGAAWYLSVTRLTRAGYELDGLTADGYPILRKGDWHVFI